MVRGQDCAGGETRVFIVGFVTGEVICAYTKKSISSLRSPRFGSAAVSLRAFSTRLNPLVPPDLDHRERTDFLSRRARSGPFSPDSPISTNYSSGSQAGYSSLAEVFVRFECLSQSVRVCECPSTRRVGETRLVCRGWRAWERQRYSNTYRKRRSILWICSQK